MIYELKDMAEAAVEAAVDEWRKGVANVGDEDRITQYFDNGGPIWSRWLRRQTKGDGYTYRQGSGVDYCGFFVGWVFSQVPYYLPPFECASGLEKPRIKQSVVTYVLPSGARMGDLSKWVQAKTAPAKHVTIGNARAGDVLIMQRQNGGHHLMIALAAPKLIDGELFVATVEGNARGHGPDPKWSGDPYDLGDGNPNYHGVVRRIRPASEIDQVRRLGMVHFEMIEI